MKNKLKTILFLILISFYGFSQDLIVKKDSSKIFCKITKEDSVTIYYKSIRDKQGLEQTIKKSDVLKYFNSTTIAKEQKIKIDTAEKIWQTKELKRGFYKNITEYLINSPSITTEFIVFKRNIAELLFQQGSEYAVKGAIDEDEVIGLCDGKDIYLNYNNHRGYSKIEYLGAYSFFTYIYYSAHSAVALIPPQLVVVDEKGNYNEASPHYIKKVLKEKYPELLIKYEAEESPREKRKEYLIKLNEYLKNKSQRSSH